MKAKPKPVYVSYYGELWRMSESQYRKLLHTAANGKDWYLGDFGKRVTEGLEDVSCLRADKAAQRYHERYEAFPTPQSCIAAIRA